MKEHISISTLNGEDNEDINSVHESTREMMGDSKIKMVAELPEEKEEEPKRKVVTKNGISFFKGPCDSKNLFSMFDPHPDNEPSKFSLVQGMLRNK